MYITIFFLRRFNRSPLRFNDAIPLTFCGIRVQVRCDMYNKRRMYFVYDIIHIIRLCIINTGTERQRPRRSAASIARDGLPEKSQACVAQRHAYYNTPCRKGQQYAVRWGGVDLFFCTGLGGVIFRMCYIWYLWCLCCIIHSMHILHIRVPFDMLYWSFRSTATAPCTGRTAYQCA